MVVIKESCEAINQMEIGIFPSCYSIKEKFFNPGKLH